MTFLNGKRTRRPAKRLDPGILILSLWDGGLIVFYLLIWVLPIVYHPFWGQQIGSLTLYEYLGLFCCLFAAVRIITSGKIPPIFGNWPTRFFFALYLIAFFSALTMVGGVNLDNHSFIIYTSSFLIFVLTVILIDSIDRLRWAILALIGSYAWASIYVIREWQKGSAVWGLEFRPGWIVGDSNFFATAAIFAITLSFYFMRGEKPRWERYYCIFCLILILVATTLCASRGAFLGLVTASPFLIWHTKRRVRNLALLTALVLPLSLALPNSPLQRILHPTISETGSEQAHKNSWNAGMRMISAHPIRGVGLGEFKHLMPKYSNVGVTGYYLAHNMFIEVAAELGIPALLLFVAIFLSSFMGLRRILRSGRVHAVVRDAAAGLQAGLVGFAVAGCFVSSEYQKTTWMSFALISCLSSLAQSHLKHRKRNISYNRRDRPNQDFREAELAAPS